MKPIFYLFAAMFFLAIAGCQKNFGNKNNGTDTTKNPTNPGNGNFDYNNTKTVAVSIRLLAPDNTPLPNTPVSFYANVFLKDNGDAADSAAIYVTRMSDADGYITENVTVPSSLDTVLIDAKYTGLIRNVKAYITGNTLNAVIGGTNVISGNVVQNYDHPASAISASGFGPAAGPNYVFMGETDVEGRPKYLVNPGDVISNKLLTYINTSLPESRSVADVHPQYITDQATGNINVIKQSDVFVTFVSEGASYLNSVGYYTYPTGHAPTSADQIGTITVMLPNSSLYGQGGNMHPGDKLSLGSFAAGTTIAFVLLDNAYSYANGVNTKALKFYGDKKLNPEANTDLKKHNVLLYDDEDNLFLAGFEDILRTSADCDHDFNDVLFYITTASGDGISKVGVQPIDKPYDNDGDGVTNVFDEYPNDPARAYNTYYPSRYGFATTAFEDEWPKTDDYDLNDLVVKYRYKFVSNAHNQVVELYSWFITQAAGASFKNGFGVEFPFNAGFVQSVTGQKLVDNYISLAGNGVEAGQQKAVIIPFDNHEALIQNYGGAYFINTKNSMPKVTGDTARVHMVFTTPLAFATLGEAPFNPFLISNERRGYEVHLPNHTPTQKADLALFGTEQDATNPSNSYYYKSADGKPWALNFPGKFINPLEQINISDAYPHYNDWVNSNGTLYKNWYSNKSSEYRDYSKLYTK